MHKKISQPKNYEELDEIEEIIRRFWAAPNEAFFTRKEEATVLRCSTAKLERWAWLGTGVPFVKNGASALYRKSDTLIFLGIRGAS